MYANWIELDHNKGMFQVLIDGDIWKNVQDKVWNEKAKSLELPHFKKGKVPGIVAKKHMDPKPVMEEACLEALNSILSQAMIKYRLYAISDPEIHIVKMDEEKAEVTVRVEVAGKPSIGKYKGLHVDREDIVVYEYEIMDELYKLQNRYTTYVDKEDGIVDWNNQVIIDFKGYKDGIPFEGGTAEDYVLVVGSNVFIPGFEEQLIGMKVNEVKDITVTFPMDYPAMELANQDVVFTITMKDVQVENKPELNDELLKVADLTEYASLDEYKEFIHSTLESQKRNRMEQMYVTKLMNMIIESSSFDIHEKMIEDDVNAMISELEENLKKQHMNLDIYLQYTNTSLDSLKQGFRNQAIDRIKNRLVLETIMDKEGITASQEEVDKIYEDYSKQYQMSIEYISQYINAETIAYDICTNKAMRFIVDHAL